MLHSPQGWHEQEALIPVIVSKNLHVSRNAAVAYQDRLKTPAQDVATSCAFWGFVNGFLKGKHARRASHLTWRTSDARHLASHNVQSAYHWVLLCSLSLDLPTRKKAPLFLGDHFSMGNASISRDGLAHGDRDLDTLRLEK